MSQIAKDSVATRDVSQNVEPTPLTDRISHTSDFITQQEVVFSTAAAISSRRPSGSRRLIDAIRGFSAALRPPAGRHYPRDTVYLERARMAREMDRL